MQMLRLGADPKCNRLLMRGHQNNCDCMNKLPTMHIMRYLIFSMRIIHSSPHQ